MWLWKLCVPGTNFQKCRWRFWRTVFRVFFFPRRSFPNFCDRIPDLLRGKRQFTHLPSWTFWFSLQLKMAFFQKILIWRHQSGPCPSWDQLVLKPINKKTLGAGGLGRCFKDCPHSNSVWKGFPPKIGVLFKNSFIDFPSCFWFSKKTHFFQKLF